MLPTKRGTSQRGEWMSLPFVFAYYENADQRWEDKVLLETIDHNIMAEIAKYCVVGADGKVVVENGSVKLKVTDIKCKCGFSHNVKEVARRDGSGMAIFNEMRCYKLDFGASVAQNQPSAPTQPAQPVVQVGDDDLPF